MNETTTIPISQATRGLARSPADAASHDRTRARYRNDCIVHLNPDGRRILMPSHARYNRLHRIVDNRDDRLD
jgi:hypothetical protein